MAVLIRTIAVSVGVKYNFTSSKGSICKDSLCITERILYCITNWTFHLE